MSPQRADTIEDRGILSNESKHVDHYNEGQAVQKPFVTCISQQSVTELRKPWLPSGQTILQNAGTARATLAASRECPNGSPTYAASRQHQTVCASTVACRIDTNAKCVGSAAACGLLGY